MTRVAYIGNFGPPHSTENHYAVSFEALGHRVWRIQENAMPTGRALRSELVANGAELLLYTRTWDTGDDDFRELLAEPPDGVATAAVHLDVWWGLARQHQIADHAMFSAQHVFTADGDHDYEWTQAGVNHHWLRPGVVDLSLVGERLGTPDPGRWPYDVAFVGSRSYHEEWPRAEFVDELRREWGKRFVHVGGDGEVPTLRGQELNDFYATVPVIVGDSLGANLFARYWSDRVYETWGRGGYLIFPDIAALSTEIGVYPGYVPGNFDTLHMLIDAALSHPRDREEYRVKFGGFVRAHCTYTQRAAQLIDVLRSEGALEAEQVA